MTRQQYVAVALLTAANLKVMGKNLERVYPLGDPRVFDDVLAAIKVARTNRTGGGDRMLAELQLRPKIAAREASAGIDYNSF